MCHLYPLSCIWIPDYYLKKTLLLSFWAIYLTSFVMHTIKRLAGRSEGLNSRIALFFFFKTRAICYPAGFQDEATVLYLRLMPCLRDETRKERGREKCSRREKNLTWGCTLSVYDRFLCCNVEQFTARLLIQPRDQNELWIKCTAFHPRARVVLSCTPLWTPV